MSRFGLSEKTISALQNIFAQFDNIEEVILYGSRAKGNFRPGSDIDMALKGQNLTLSDLLKIENLIGDLLLPEKVDLCLFHKIDNSDLISHIHHIGIRFFPH